MIPCEVCGYRLFHDEDTDADQHDDDCPVPLRARIADLDVEVKTLQKLLGEMAERAGALRAQVTRVEALRDEWEATDARRIGNVVGRLTKALVGENVTG